MWVPLWWPSGSVILLGMAKPGRWLPRPQEVDSLPWTGWAGGPESGRGPDFCEGWCRGSGGGPARAVGATRHGDPGVLWAGAGGGPEPTELQNMWGHALLSSALGKLRQPSGSGQALVLPPVMLAMTTGGGRLHQAETGQVRGQAIWERGQPPQPFRRPSPRGFRKGLKVLHLTQSPWPSLRAPEEPRASGEPEGGWTHSLGSGEPPPNSEAWLSLPETWDPDVSWPPLYPSIQPGYSLVLHEAPGPSLLSPVAAGKRGMGVLVQCTPYQPCLGAQTAHPPLWQEEGEGAAGPKCSGLTGQALLGCPVLESRCTAAGQCPVLRGSAARPQKQDALPLEPGLAPLLSGLSLGSWDPPSAAWRLCQWLGPAPRSPGW